LVFCRKWILIIAASSERGIYGYEEVIMFIHSCTSPKPSITTVLKKIPFKETVAAGMFTS
jgi:hypothetical protein